MYIYSYSLEHYAFFYVFFLTTTPSISYHKLFGLFSNQNSLSLTKFNDNFFSLSLVKLNKF